jgi:hypothetical protein
MNKKMVHYKAEGMNDSKRLKEAVGELVLTKTIVIETISNMFGWNIIFLCKPSDAKVVQSRLLPVWFGYASPVYYYKSSIRSIYMSAEDELEERPTQEYIDYKKTDDMLRS